MPKASPIQNSFNAGEFSPLLFGRIDLEKYRSALAECTNFIPLAQGPVTRRPGTHYVAEVKDSTKAARLVSFEFSTTQAYIIEFGDQYLRFYMNNGQILASGIPYEIVSPYGEADLFQLKFAQSADVLYITHPAYATRKLTRTGHTSWTITEVDLLDGPYDRTNSDTAKTITPSAVTGTGITLTATGHAPFVATDIGRLVRLKNAATWGYAKITGYTSSTVVTADVKADFGGTTATPDWRLGWWSATTGYPAAVTFYEDRLFLGGGTDFPQSIAGSRTGDYENMAPTDPDGTVAPDHAVSFTLNANNVNVIRWLQDDDKGLLVGTVGGEWHVRPSVSGEALSPTNISAKRSTTHGGADIQPVRVGTETHFVQRMARKMRGLRYVFEDDGFRAPDSTLLAEHITAPGLVELSYQQEPLSVLWSVRADGTLLGFTLERDQNVLGWHKHVLGGYRDINKTASAKVESVATIPDPSGTRDEVWLLVTRYLNGTVKRYVEYMGKVWESGDTQTEAFFVDSGLRYSGPAVTSLSGLDHLEGETVSVLADGAVHPDEVVVGGSITLDRAASEVAVGLRYNSDLTTLRIEAGSADGTAQGKTKRIHRVLVRLHETLGLKYGPSASQLDTLTFRTASDTMTTAVPLFSGDKELDWDGDYETKGQLHFRQDQPLPATIVAVMPQLVAQDR